MNHQVVLLGPEDPFSRVDDAAGESLTASSATWYLLRRFRYAWVADQAFDGHA